MRADQFATAERLEVLRRYGIVDTPEEPEFDEIVRLAARLFDCPTALISFIETDRQWFKARLGFETCETSRDVSSASTPSTGTR